MRKRFIYSILIALCMMNSGCRAKDKLPRCEPTLPKAEAFLNLSALSPLQYYKRIEYRPETESGYDMWADSKFEFRSGLQYGFIALPHMTNEYCYDNVTFLLALPLSSEQRDMLIGFVHQVALQYRLNEKTLQPDILTLLNDKSPIKTIYHDKHVAFRAGIMHHQFRGDFFVASIEAPSVGNNHL